MEKSLNIFNYKNRPYLVFTAILLFFLAFIFILIVFDLFKWDFNKLIIWIFILGWGIGYFASKLKIYNKGKLIFTDKFIKTTDKSISINSSWNDIKNIDVYYIKTNYFLGILSFIRYNYLPLSISNKSEYERIIIDKKELFIKIMNRRDEINFNELILIIKEKVNDVKIFSKNNIGGEMELEYESSPPC